VPHCRWSVTIDPGAEPLPEPAQAERIAQTRAAAIDIPQPGEDDTDGRTTYDGPLEPDLVLETFSRNTLIALLNEVALQGHLLTMSFADAVERRTDADTAADVVRKQFIGIAGVAAARIATSLSITDPSTVLTLHPAFHPRTYMHVDVRDAAITLGDCPAIGDRPGRTWADVLADGGTEPLDAIVQAVDPRTYCVKSRRNAWTIETADEPHRMSREVKLTRFSTGADFVFQDRSP
jgi:hypothetical protein